MNSWSLICNDHSIDAPGKVSKFDGVSTFWMQSVANVYLNARGFILMWIVKEVSGIFTVGEKGTIPVSLTYSNGAVTWCISKFRCLFLTLSECIVFWLFPRRRHSCGILKTSLFWNCSLECFRVGSRHGCFEKL